MTTTWILVVLAILAVGIFGFLATRPKMGAVSTEGAILMIRSIDIDAFRNLVDPREECFLRDNLPRREFWAVKRDRAWAALAYVRSAGRAAVLFAAAGQNAQLSSDPQTVESGKRIAESALRLRFYSLLAGVRLLISALLPGLNSRSVTDLIDEYETTADTVLRLSSQQAIFEELRTPGLLEP